MKSFVYIAVLLCPVLARANVLDDSEKAWEKYKAHLGPFKVQMTTTEDRVVMESNSQPTNERRVTTEISGEGDGSFLTAKRDGVQYGFGSNNDYRFSVKTGKDDDKWALRSVEWLDNPRPKVPQGVIESLLPFSNAFQGLTIDTAWLPTLMVQPEFRIVSSDVDSAKRVHVAFVYDRGSIRGYDLIRKGEVVLDPDYGYQIVSAKSTNLTTKYSSSEVEVNNEYTYDPDMNLRVLTKSKVINSGTVGPYIAKNAGTIKSGTKVLKIGTKVVITTVTDYKWLPLEKADMKQSLVSYYGISEPIKASIIRQYLFPVSIAVVIGVVCFCLWAKHRLDRSNPSKSFK